MASHILQKVPVNIEHTRTAKRGGRELKWCMQAAEKQTSPAAAAASSTASRFAYNEIVEEETQKTPNVHRGKDGHLKLGSGGDFFSNPLGDTGASSPSAGPSRSSR